MKVDLRFVAAEGEDLAEIVRLNLAAVPNVNELSLDRMKHLIQESAHFEIALTASEAGWEIGGFLMAMDESADYASVNYQYFRRQFPSFIYVDRIVVDPRFHRSGIGQQLYQRMFDRFRPFKPVACCEVNLEPPNPVSVAFHERQGFAGVDEQETENGTKRVQLLVKSLGD